MACGCNKNKSVGASAAPLEVKTNSIAPKTKKVRTKRVAIAKNAAAMRRSKTKRK